MRQIVRKNAAFVVALGLFSSCGSGDSPTAPSEGQIAARVVVLGDSLAVSPSNQQSFPTHLQAHLNRAGMNALVVNSSGWGDTTADGLRRLDAALADDYDGVAQLFGSESGVAARLGGSLDQTLATDALINTRSKALNAKSVELQKKQADLELRMAQIEKRYNTQFNALDSLLAGMSSQSAFLTQQLSSIAKIGDK